MSSFGTDLAGEIYLVSWGGSIYRLDRQGAVQPAGCAMPDPYAHVGGGRCYSGSWFAPVVRGDLSGDGMPDLLLQDGAPFSAGPGNNGIYAWLMNGATLWQSAPLSMLPASTDPLDTSGWLAIATDDFNGDGRSDVLLQYAPTGALRVAVMHGLRQIATQIAFPGSTPWRVVATGDLNRDNVSDIVWQHASSGLLYAWLVRGGATFGVLSEGFLLNEASAPLTVGDLNMRVAGSGDFNGDGNADLVLQHQTTGALSLFYMDGLQRTSVGTFSPSPATTGVWRVRAVADFNGDRRPDLVWQQAAAGSSAIYIWYMNGPSLVGQGFATPSASVGVGIVGGR